MTDLTIIYASAQKSPVNFREKVQRELSNAAGDYPVYLAIDPPEKSSITNYYQTLVEVAYDIDTPYLAFAEDDTLYPDEHFNHRPSDLETFAYNFTRWNLYTWSDPPFYSLRQRKILATLIAPRIAFIDVMERRLKLNESQMVEPGRREGEKFETFNTYNPVVVFTHPDAFGYMGGNKRANKIRALSLPYWGEADKLKEKYYGK
jgi:hypothetical protein